MNTYPDQTTHPCDIEQIDQHHRTALSSDSLYCHFFHPSIHLQLTFHLSFDSVGLRMMEYGQTYMTESVGSITLLCILQLLLSIKDVLVGQQARRRLVCSTVMAMKNHFKPVMENFHFACSPRAYVGFLWVLRPPPTAQ